MNSFSKEKLAEVQAKKAKGGTVSGLLSKKKVGDVVKKESTKTPPPAKRSTSPTSSLEMIASGGVESTKKKKLVGGFLQALGESLFASEKFLDLEKNVASLEPLIKALSAKNEMFKYKVVILAAEAENDKELMATLEKSLQVEKDFCKLKDKQIGDLELMLQNVRAMVVHDFKDSDELCKYYVEDFDLLVKWMAKHHIGLDLSGLAVEDVEKELMFDRPSETTAENVTEEATDVAEGVKEATVVTPTDPVPEDQQSFIIIIFSLQGKNNISLLGPLFWATKQFL
nr:hypothetical protein CFP56_32543 [Quercus suber]